MTRIYTFLIALLLGVGQLHAQSARLQLIHNSPSPTVDIWVNGQPFETNFDFRTATAFQDVPAGVDLIIGIAPSPSTSVNDIVETFTVRFDEGIAYTVLAQGVLNDMDRPFRVKVIADAREAGTSNDKLDITVVHGGQDAPAVDVFARDLVQLVDGASFDDNTPYTSIDPIRYLLDVKADDMDPIITTFEADLEGLGGGSAVVFASGYLNPDSDQPRFGIFAALPNGDVVEFPEVSIARAQIIHNAIAPTVDISARDVATLAENLAFRQSTPYIAVPADRYLIDFRAAGTDPIVATFEADLSNLGGGAAVVFASGFLNPDGNQPAFGVFAALPNGDVATFPAASIAKLQIIHNAIAPTVDVWVNNEPFQTGLEFRGATEFVEAPADIELNIGLAASPSTMPSQIVQTFPVTLENGETYIVTAQGILNDNDQPLDLDVKAGARLAGIGEDVDIMVVHGSPDAPTVDVVARGVADPLVDDLDFGNYADDYISVPAGSYDLGITPADDNANILFEYRADVGALGGQAITIFASGFVGDTPGFELWVADANGNTFPLALITSTQELSNIESLMLYPNPVATATATLEYELTESSDISWRISDYSGRLLQIQRIGSQPAGVYRQEVNVGELPMGVYLIQFQTDAGIATQKIIVGKNN